MYNHYYGFILLIATALFQQLPCTADKYRIYHESNGQVCIWQGNAPFCFIGSGCPINSTVVKTSKFGDGGYCWIGMKYYCCV